MKLCSVLNCGRPHHGRGYCRLHAHRDLKHGDPNAVLNQRGMPLKERLLQKAVIQDSGCWVWRGQTNRDGYGMMNYDGKNRSVHRLSYSAFRGQPPVGLELDHLCRNRACINPEHLELVTHQENSRRGLLKKDTCVRGHPLAYPNLYARKMKNGRVSTSCKACQMVRTSKYRRRVSLLKSAAMKHGRG